jgi:ParB-like nuclease domain
MSNLGAKGFNPKKGSMPVLQWMPPKMLAVDPAYQRSIDNTSSKALIQRIARDWDWDLCQPLVVSRRDDNQLYVVDGQHRLAAAIARNDIEQLPCFICSLPDIAAEADRFVQFNRNRKALKPLDLWKAAVASGDANALQINAAVAAAGLIVHSNSNNNQVPNALVNIGGLQRCHRDQGFEQLSLALHVLGNAYRDEILQYAGTIFTGIAAIVADECKNASAAEIQNGPIGAAIIACIAARKQSDWFTRVQRRIADKGQVRLQATEMIFRNAWAIECAKQDPRVTVISDPVPAAPAPPPSPRITETIDVPKITAVVSSPPPPKAGSLDPLAKAIIEKHGMATPAKAKA